MIVCVARDLGLIALQVNRPFGVSHSSGESTAFCESDLHDWTPLHYHTAHIGRGRHWNAASVMEPYERCLPGVDGKHKKLVELSRADRDCRAAEQRDNFGYRVAVSYHQHRARPTPPYDIGQRLSVSAANYLRTKMKADGGRLRRLLSTSEFRDVNDV